MLSCNRVADRERGDVATRLVVIGPEDGGGGFDLLLGDRVILRHRVAAPAFRIAKGDPAITMVRGNFRMADAPRDPRIPCHLVESEIGADQAVNTIGLACEPGGPIALTVTLAGQPNALLTAATTDPEFDRIALRLVTGPDEMFWGGGEQMSHLALNGRRWPMWTSEPGVGREPGTPLTDLMSSDGSFAGGDYWTTNYPEPTILSSANYALSLTGGAAGAMGYYTEIDLTQPGQMEWHCWSGNVSLAIAAASSPADLVGLLAGRFPAARTLPDWAIGGAIVGLKDGANSFARLEALIAAGAAVSGLWCEDWVGIRQTSFGRRLFWDWQWNPERYPDLPARIAALKARGIRFLGYVNPYLAADGPQFAEAVALGYLALQQDSDAPYLVDFGEFDAGVVDFTNPAAADWFSEEIIGKRMLDIGLDGWMADFGEYLPVDLRLHAGDPMLEHNLWPVRWAKVNANAIASRGRTGDALFFMRAGFTGVQEHCPLLWAGDQSVDFSRHDGIGTVITAALSSGLVGNAFSHSDVGGYTSLHGNIRTAELLLRWYELGAFSPVMRTHEGNRPEDNLQIDSSGELIAGFVRWSRVHEALAPYVKHLVAEAQATGLPAQRALFLHYPDDRETFTIQDQYLYGADLMVAPVIDEGAVERRVYLPGVADMVWRHVWSGRDYAPGWHDVPAPIGHPPVFYRPASAFAPLFESLAA
jgi:alpha-glucosidase